MNKYKYIIWSIVISLVLSSCISIFTCSVVASGDVEVDKMYSDKQEYLFHKYNGEYQCFLAKWGEDFANHPFEEGVLLTVLLYTDIAKEITFIKHEISGQEFLMPGEIWFCALGDSTNYYISSPEIDKAIGAWTNEYGNIVRDEKSSHLRACIEYFGIPREELILANQKMQKDIDGKVLRELFQFLSDSDFEAARKDNGLYYIEPLSDFMIDALYWEDEDDQTANNLLCKPYAVYVKELDRTVTSEELANVIQSSDYITVEEFATFDLTANWMGDFINYCDNWWSGLDENEILILRLSREKQLAEKAGREAAFVAELGSMLTAERLFGTAETAPTVTVAELAVCDLTGEDMGNFLSYLRENIESYESAADPADGRTPLEKLEYLEAQREAQLKAAETGDGMEKAFLVIGFSITALALTAVLLKKRKI